MKQLDHWIHEIPVYLHPTTSQNFEECGLVTVSLITGVNFKVLNQSLENTKRVWENPPSKQVFSSQSLLISIPVVTLTNVNIKF